MIDQLKLTKIFTNTHTGKRVHASAMKKFYTPTYRQT